MPFVDTGGGGVGIGGGGGGGGGGGFGGSSPLGVGFGFGAGGPLGQSSDYAKRRLAGLFGAAPMSQPAGALGMSPFLGSSAFGNFLTQANPGGGGYPGVGAYTKSFQGSLSQGLNAGAQAGYLDPYGSQGLINLLQNQYSGMAGANEQAAREEANQRFADNPAAAAWAGINAGIQGRSALARGLQGVAAQSALQNQQALQQLYANWIQNKLGQDTMTHAQNMQGPWGAIGGALGQVGGAALGGLGGLFGGGGANMYQFGNGWGQNANGQIGWQNLIGG